MRNIVYDMLSDIVFRFRVSFGYDDLMFSDETRTPWIPQNIRAINEIVMDKMLHIRFHWRYTRREDGKMEGVARIPKWRDMANFSNH